MSSTKKTISDLQARIKKHEEDAAHLKQTVNMLCEAEGMDPLYADTAVSNDGLDQIRSDTFYGQPTNTAMRMYLEMRNAAGRGPASVRDIYEALQSGGFQFDAKSDENAMRGLRISLSKSSHTFHRLPGGDYGLLEWYPAVKDKKAKGENGDADDQNDTENDSEQ